jgi:hypothetical protein
MRSRVARVCLVLCAGGGRTFLVGVMGEDLVGVELIRVVQEGQGKLQLARQPQNALHLVAVQRDLREGGRGDDALGLVRWGAGHGAVHHAAATAAVMMTMMMMMMVLMMMGAPSIVLGVVPDLVGVVELHLLGLDLGHVPVEVGVHQHVHRHPALFVPAALRGVRVPHLCTGPNRER